MRERHARVLSGLIAEYIKTGQPVSSKQLAGKINLDLSPASIRAIMQDLCHAGFAYQPHTSAGRVPTDSGYRFYLDHLIVGHVPALLMAKMRRRYEELVNQYASQQLAMAELLAHITQSLAVVGSIDDTQFEQSGISNLFKDKREDQLNLMQEISVLLDNMHNLLRELSKSKHSDTTVFVGRENPYFSSNHISLILHLDSDSDIPQSVVMIVGPKRMQYGRNLALLNEIHNIVITS